MLSQSSSVHADASFLDEWSFDQFQSLLNRSKEDPKLRGLLLQDNLVIFLHLLGCDSNGHAHKPYSSIYLNNVKVVDNIAARVYNLVEDYFKDNRTAYIFTADHGMSDKGEDYCILHYSDTGMCNLYMFICALYALLTSKITLWLNAWLEL